jgi:serine/threonine protein kinase
VAPECCGADDLEQTAPRPYTKAADIWSMGCLFSDMLVRSSLGQDGVSRYRDAREAENKQFHVPNHNPQCFHNGIERLSCVDEFHRKVLEKHPEDDVLRVVSDIILDHMLKPIRERLDDALTIRRYWENHIGARSNANSGLSTAGLSALASTVTPASPLSLPTQPLASLHRQGTLSPTITAATPTVTPAATLMVSLDTTGRPALITVRDIADFLRCRQKPWSFARSAPKVLEAFPGLRSALSVMGSRNHVRY